MPVHCGWKVRGPSFTFPRAAWTCQPLFSAALLIPFIAKRAVLKWAEPCNKNEQNILEKAILSSKTSHLQHVYVSAVGFVGAL